VTMMPLGPCPYVEPGMERHVNVKTFSVGPKLKEAVSEGRVEYIPSHLSEIPHFFKKRIIPVDVVVVQLSPPDKQGYCSLGISVNYMPEVINSAHLVIGEVNEQMPKTMGHGFVHLSQLDYIIEASYPLPTLQRGKIREEERKIGNFVSDLITDGSTLQVGIGAIADAIVSELKGRKNLRIHTGTFSDWVMDLFENGALDCKRGGCITSMDIMGSAELYDFCGNNPLIDMRPISFTHNIGVLSQLEKFICITSAIEVDLSGQVNAEVASGTLINGVGGQLDFIRGSATSPGGKSIIALRSTAQQGKVSRIVPQLNPENGVVTVGRADVDYIVTEYGIANLKGKSIRERKEALISVAHPSFRDSLEKCV